MPSPYTRAELLRRKLKNSAAFDRASYEADGGDAWVEPRRRELFDGAKAKDKALWLRAAEATIAARGCEDWQFQVWWYLKQGGAF